MKVFARARWLRMQIRARFTSIAVVTYWITLFLLLLLPSMSSSLSSQATGNGAKNPTDAVASGTLEQLKQREAELSRLLAEIRREKLHVLRDRPLKIGVMGFGRFGQFIAHSFSKYGNVIGTSRSDYTDVANEMDAIFIPLSQPDIFLNESLDVIVLAVSIVSFEDTVKKWSNFLRAYIEKQRQCGGSTVAPLIVDVCSVKEHPREILLKYLPEECDILCTHPMFGPDSGKDSWKGLTFVYERTRINGVILDPDRQKDFHQLSRAEENSDDESFLDKSGHVHFLHENDEGFVEGMDRIERFL